MTCNSNIPNSVSLEEKNAKSSMASIPHKILVMSGKGGVGKTTVSVNLAYAFAASGLSTGIVDADLHGPNVALMTGIEGVQTGGDEGVLDPVEASNGVKVLSISSFLPDSNSPVVWRGPRKSAIIRQFLGQGNWANIDVLIVDCPPGTGDEPMTVAQLIPDADGVIIVTSPQDVALLDSRKCVNFVHGVEQKVIGIIENFSGYTCPDCGSHVDLFKSGGGEKAAKELDVPFLGRIPIAPDMVTAGDNGKPLVNSLPDNKAAKVLSNIAMNLKKTWQQTSENKDKEMSEIKNRTYIAIAAEDDKGFDGEVSGHFGRCPFYFLVGLEDNKIVGSDTKNNPFYGNHQPGQMPEFIRDLGANVILAGGMGPKAVDMFNNFGIEVATGAIGNVKRVVDAYLAGKIKGTVPCNHDHSDSCGGH